MDYIDRKEETLNNYWELFSSNPQVQGVLSTQILQEMAETSRLTRSEE